jgi:COMPASS component SWD2
MTSPPRVSMEITDEMLKSMEVGLAFRDYISSHTRTSLL